MDDVNVRATARVTCPGVEGAGNNVSHTIKLLTDGKLVLCDHKQDMDDHRGMYEFDPGYRCRCLEVLTWWRIYTAGPKYEVSEDGTLVDQKWGHYPKDENGDTLRWIQDSMKFKDDYGAVQWKQETHKYAFYQLPKALRPAAQTCAIFNEMRRVPRNISEGDPRLAVKDGTFLEGKWTRILYQSQRKETLHALLQRRLARHGMKIDMTRVGSWETEGFLESVPGLPFKVQALAQGILILDAPPPGLRRCDTEGVFFFRGRKLVHQDGPGFVPDWADRVHHVGTLQWFTAHRISPGVWNFHSSNTNK